MLWNNSTQSIMSHKPVWNWYGMVWCLLLSLRGVNFTRKLVLFGCEFHWKTGTSPLPLFGQDHIFQNIFSACLPFIFYLFVDSVFIGLIRGKVRIPLSNRPVFLVSRILVWHLHVEIRSLWRTLGSGCLGSDSTPWVRQSMFIRFSVPCPRIRGGGPVLISVRVPRPRVSSSSDSSSSLAPLWGLTSIVTLLVQSCFAGSPGDCPLLDSSNFVCTVGPWFHWSFSYGGS